jgi:hypothetical protein
MEYVKRKASIRLRRMKRRKTAFVVLCLLSGACHHGAYEGPPEPRTETRLRVENQNFLDMNVYVLAGSQRMRLGTVTGLSTQVFTIPPHLVRGPPLRFEVHPIGGRSNPRSETILVQPGDEVQLTIPPS